MKPHENGEVDPEKGKLEKEKYKMGWNYRPSGLRNQAVLSCLAYCVSSCSMILANKYVLSTYNFNAGVSLMLFQNFISVIVVSALSFLLGAVSTEPLTWMLIRIWLPVNVIFVGMLITSMFSLKYINVAMVTILKNVTNVITALGEMYLFKKHHGGIVWAALFLMIMNCLLTASYSLSLRAVMDASKRATGSGSFNEFSMVLLNNTLSLPLGAILLLVSHEVDYLANSPLLMLPEFWLVTTLSGLLGLAISLTSVWFLHQTDATTYSLVGSLNKIPLSIVGILLFKVPTTLENLTSIFFGLLAGVIFARAKMREKF